MPHWFKIPAKFIADADNEVGGVAVAINLDSIAFIIQEQSRDGKPGLNITTTSGPLRLHGISLEVFLSLSVTSLTTETIGESAGDKGE